MSATATYLYCIVKSSASPSVARVPRGIPGATTPRIVAVTRSIRMAVADVPLDVYGPGPLEQALSNVSWVSDVALAHEAVVEHFSRGRGASVIPMKLFTMFSSEDRAIVDITARKRDIDRVFDRISGCAEWGVRITRAPGARGPAGRAAKVSSGAAFLAAKKKARDDARESAVLAAESAEEAYEALVRLARAATRRDSEPGGAVSPPLVDAAFLVRAAGLARFKAEARRVARSCAAAGADMTLSGPWPAYNFVQIEASR